MGYYASCPNFLYSRAILQKKFPQINQTFSVQLVLLPDNHATLFACLTACPKATHLLGQPWCKVRLDKCTDETCVFKCQLWTEFYWNRHKFKMQAGHCRKTTYTGQPEICTQDKTHIQRMWTLQRRHTRQRLWQKPPPCPRYQPLTSCIKLWNKHKLRQWHRGSHCHDCGCQPHFEGSTLTTRHPKKEKTPRVIIWSARNDIWGTTVWSVALSILPTNEIMRGVPCSEHPHPVRISSCGHIPGCFVYVLYSNTCSNKPKLEVSVHTYFVGASVKFWLRLSYQTLLMQNISEQLFPRWC